MTRIEHKFLILHLKANIIVYNKETEEIYSAVYSLRSDGGFRQHPTEILFSDFVKEELRTQRLGIS